MELKCDKCGKIDYVLVDGYSFGDRLLEGVMFMVKDENGKPKAIDVVPDAKEYFEELNTTVWLKRCEDFCEDLDLAECPKCGEEVAVWGNKITASASGTWQPLIKPIKTVPMSNMRQVLKDLTVLVDRDAQIFSDKHNLEKADETE